MVGKGVDGFHDYEAGEKKEDKKNNEGGTEKKKYDINKYNEIIKKAEKKYEKHEKLAKNPEKSQINADKELEKKLKEAYSSDHIPYQISNKENLAANAQISTEGKIGSVANVESTVGDMLTAIGIKDTRIGKRLS